MRLSGRGYVASEPGRRHRQPASTLRHTATRNTATAPSFASSPPRSPAIRSVFVSTYPPRRCGIATFTADLAAATGEARIAALRFPGDVTAYGSEVAHQIGRNEPADYRRVAYAIDHSDAEVVSIQHEYGIWGGPDGELVLDFVRSLHTPVVTTLHTLPRQPTESQRRILVDLVEHSTSVVVMSWSAARLLHELYGVDEECVEVVPHGVPDLPLVDPDTVKARLGLERRPIILSFGLLGPGKGYETAIEAMPEVARSSADALYVILGATHPELLRREGEAYRNRLERLAESLGVQDRVQFVDQYVTLEELGRWLEAADIFVTPYPNLDQIVSGTLSYAMAAGKAIVSTPYAYAREMLDHGVGVLVEPGSPKALAEALGGLLEDDETRHCLGGIAYERSRSMIWPEVGARYREIFERVTGRRHAIRFLPERGEPRTAAVQPASARPPLALRPHLAPAPRLGPVRRDGASAPVAGRRQAAGRTGDD